MYIIKNKGFIMVEIVLSLAIISLVILPIFSQSSFLLRFLQDKKTERGEEIIREGILKGAGLESEIEVEIVNYSGEESYILITDRKEGICR
ncbi:MAG: hypothetical protein ACRCU6_02480 [Fusobacteriaceae bacterium]